MMLETDPEFELKLKQNRLDNVRTELSIKREELQKMLNQEKAQEFGTEESVAEADALQKEIHILEAEQKNLEKILNS